MRFIQVVMLSTVLLASGAYSQPIPKDLEITLERTMCWGWCPAYTLVISSDGTVKFTPVGTYVYLPDGPAPSFPLIDHVTPEQLRVLTAEFEKIRFHSLRKRYGRAGSSSDGPSCPNYWTDSPSAFLTLVSNGKRKSVSHYLGCNGAKVLEDLVALEEKIDEIARTKRWTSQFGWKTANVTDLKLRVNTATAPPPTQKP